VNGVTISGLRPELPHAVRRGRAETPIALNKIVAVPVSVTARDKAGQRRIVCMKNRTRKKRLSQSRKLPAQFVKDTLRALAEATAGKLIPYKCLFRRGLAKDSKLLGKLPRTE
jgi:hypothetical protein